MSGAPVVTATPDKSSYQQGEAVTVTFTVAGDTRDQADPKTITYTGHDDEGNSVTGTLTVIVHRQVADGFTLDSVSWQGGDAFAINGLVATGTA